MENEEAGVVVCATAPSLGAQSTISGSLATVEEDDVSYQDACIVFVTCCLGRAIPV
jgi:hypothetical protein